jgi:hypothetical protein
MRGPLWRSVGTALRNLPLIAALALVIACRKNKSIAAEEIERVAKWTAWFDAAFHELPTATSPPAAPSDWVEARSSDGVRVRLGRDYRRRNDNCWATGTEQGPGWRDVCVNAMNAALFSVPGFHLEPRPPDPDITDQIEFASWRAEGLTFGDRRAIVERARASGGFSGEQVRSMSVVIELSSGKAAIFRGQTGDDGGYDELLGIASTIEPPVP